MMKRFRGAVVAVIGLAFILVAVAGLKPVIAAEEVQMESITILRTYNEVLETVGGVIEIEGDFLKDTMVRVQTAKGSQILGVDLGKRVHNLDEFLKFELNSNEIDAIYFSDGLTVAGKKVATDNSLMPTINSVEPKVIYLKEGTLQINGSNLHNDELSFGGGTFNGTIKRTENTITVENPTGDPQMHDIVFTRQLENVANVSQKVTIRKLYQNQFRAVYPLEVSDLEMYPNKGVPGRTTVYFQAPQLDKYSVFFLRNVTDPYYSGNMGTDHEYIPRVDERDTIKVKVPNLIPGTYKVVLTNFVSGSQANQDLRNEITREMVVGDFVIISADNAPEIVNLKPVEGPNDGETPVTIVGKNIEELYIDKLEIDDEVKTPDQKSLHEAGTVLKINYGSGTYRPGDKLKPVLVEKDLRVHIGSPAIFQSLKEQDFIKGNNQYDTVEVVTQGISSLDMAKNPSQDVVIDIITTITVTTADGTPTGEIYEFKEQVKREKGFTYIPSFTEPVINKVVPDKIQVVDDGGYQTRVDMVLGIYGQNFKVTRYLEPATGEEKILYPRVDLGGVVFLAREGKDKNHVVDRNGNPIAGASLEILDGTTTVDGSTGWDSGNCILIRIPAGLKLDLKKDGLNFPTYIEITNPKTDSGDYGYPLRKSDIIQFVTVSENKTPVITGVTPEVVSVEGEKGIRIEGYNFQPDVKVFLGGAEVSFKRDPSSQLIIFDAPKGREGTSRLVVMNGEGGQDSTNFTYVKTTTDPRIFKVSPPEGTINSLVVINGDVFMAPDPTATETDMGIYRLIGSRVLFDNQDVNQYYYQPDTNRIGLQGYTGPATDKILRAEGDQVVLAGYYYSVLLKDRDSKQFLVFKENHQGQIIITDGVGEYIVSADSGVLKATDRTGQVYNLVLASGEEADCITLKGAAIEKKLDLVTPYQVDPASQIITGHRVQVIDQGRRILVMVPNLGAQGLYDVTVVNPDTKKVTLPDAFKFYKRPQVIPGITSIEPERGSTQGGYFIEIRGANFEDNGVVKSRVFINTIEVAAADTFVRADGKSIRVKVPPYPGDLRKELGVDQKSVPVNILNPTDGGSTGLEKGFTYIVPTSQPVIDRLSRTEGQAAGGEYVQIIGRDFRFFEPFEDTLVVDFKYTPGEPFTDLNGDGSYTDLSGKGTTQDLSEDDKKILPRVYFGNQTAEIVDFGKNFIGVLTPLSSSGKVEVYVLNNDFGMSNSKPFTFKGSQPVINSIIPAVGKKQGNEPVEIHGFDFKAGSIKLLQPGGIKTREQVMVRFGEISNAGDPEAGVIVGGEVPRLELPGGLTVSYQASKQSIRLVLTPHQGESYAMDYLGFDGSPTFFDLSNLVNDRDKPYYGYEMVRVQVVQDPANRLIVERGFAPVVDVVDSGHLIVRTPSYYTVGEVPVAVINPDQSQAFSKFTYMNPDSSPRIINIMRDGQNPEKMKINGRTIKVLRMNHQGHSKVSVLGEDFRENAAIQIGDTKINPGDITYTLPGKLTFTMPDVSEKNIGVLHRLVVINQDGGIAASDEPSSGLEEDKIYIQFTRGESGPKVTTITPDTGPVAGGTRVKIEGEDFRSRLEGYENQTMTVYFGGQKATGVERVDYKTIYAFTPVNMPGQVEVRVENPDGEISSPGGIYTYISNPRVTAVVSPTDPTENEYKKTISVKGGQEIKIKGTGFMEGARVVFAPVTTWVDSLSFASNIIYRMTNKKVDNFSSNELELYRLDEGIEGSEVKFIDTQTLVVKTPPGKMNSQGLIVINPDQGASDSYDDISYDLPELEAPEGKVWAEIVHDQYHSTDRAIKVTWNPVTGATSYDIYVIEDQQTEFAGSSSTTTFLYKNLEPRTTYKFLIKAVGDFGSSSPSAESNKVRTGHKVGAPDGDGEIGDRTNIQRRGDTAYVVVGRIDHGSQPLNIDLTRGDLAGARVAVISIPAEIVVDYRAGDIQVKGKDFSLKFNPGAFKISRVIENRNRSTAGVRFKITPYSGTTNNFNNLSSIYQLQSEFYLDQDKVPLHYLASNMSLVMDYDTTKASWRRLENLGLYRYDENKQTWQRVGNTPALVSAAAGSINQMGLYTVGGQRQGERTW